MQELDNIRDIKQDFLLRHDGWVALAVEKDPALQGKPHDQVLEEIMSYPGLTAVAVHEKAHALYKDGKFAAARRLSEQAHTLSGIDIHPGAEIDPTLFIDHGTGTVIGETAHIGENTQLYHCVTLGAYGKKTRNVEDPKTRETRTVRHPQLGNDVTVSLGAQILGPSEIGSRVSVGPGAQIINCKVGVGAVIGPGVRLMDAEVPDGASVLAEGQRVTALPRKNGLDEKQSIKAFQMPVAVNDWGALKSLYEQVLQNAKRFEPFMPQGRS